MVLIYKMLYDTLLITSLYSEADLCHLRLWFTKGTSGRQVYTDIVIPHVYVVHAIYREGALA